MGSTLFTFCVSHGHVAAIAPERVAVIRLRAAIVRSS